MFVVAVWVSSVSVQLHSQDEKKTARSSRFPGSTPKGILLPNGWR